MLQLPRCITAFKAGCRSTATNLADDSINPLAKPFDILESRNINRHDKVPVAARQWAVNHIAEFGTERRAGKQGREDSRDDRQPRALEPTDGLKQACQRPCRIGGRMAAAATPNCAARAIDSFMAKPQAICPIALPPSTTRTALLCLATRGRPLGSTPSFVNFFT